MDLDALTRRLVESEDTGEGGPQPWQVVNRKKRPFTGVKGTQKNEGRLKEVSECCDFYVGRCSPETSVDDINNFVSNVIDVPTISCVKISADESKVKSFKLTVLAENEDKLLDPSVWPKNIRVRRYFYSRNNGRKQF